MDLERFMLHKSPCIIRLGLYLCRKLPTNFSEEAKNKGQINSASFKIKIKGEKKKGDIYLSMIKEGQEWEIKKFDIVKTTGLPLWLELLS